MSAQSGKDLKIYISNGSSPSSIISGMRLVDIVFDASGVDITNLSSLGMWRELMDAAGKVSASISATGVFTVAGSDIAIRAAFFSQTIKEIQIAIPNFGTITGPFKIARLHYKGGSNSEIETAITLASAGAMSFSAS